VPSPRKKKFFSAAVGPGTKPALSYPNDSASKEMFLQASSSGE
jgi:hypothetical protein